jgi:hypothetical protein
MHENSSKTSADLAVGEQKPDGNRFYPSANIILANVRKGFAGG